MKVNMKVFNKLNREPDIKQEVNKKPYYIYFATEEEKDTIFNYNEYVSILSSNGLEYKLLIDKDAYMYGINNEYYTSRMNAIRVELLEKVTKVQKISLWAIIFPITLLFILCTTLIFIFKNEIDKRNNHISTWIILVSLIIIFASTFLVNKLTRNKVSLFYKQMQKKIEEELGEGKFNELSKSMDDFNKTLRDKRKKEKEERLQQVKEEYKQEQIKKEEGKENKK